MRRVSGMLGLMSLLCSGCQTYKYAADVKMVSFSDDFSEGQSMGNVVGEDCVTTILGYTLGPVPTLDRAMARAQSQKTQGVADNLLASNEAGGMAIRYINNVSSSWEGFDAVVFKKSCLQVKGRGYK